jgi:hypothetical protein
MRQAVRTRNFAEERDCFMALRGAVYYRNFKGRDPRSVTEAEVQRVTKDLAMQRPLSHRQQLYEVIEPQILELFSYIETLPGGMFDPYPEPQLVDAALPGPGTDALDAEIARRQEAEKAARRAEGGVQIRRKSIAHPGGFRLRIERSSVEHADAGFGVVVEGVVQPGTVVALYPGTIYFPVDPLGDGRPFAEAMKEQLQNSYLIRRYDDLIIDGRDWHLRALKLKAQSKALSEAGVMLASDVQHAASLRAGDVALAKYRNPFAIANFINHPPKGQSANVLQWSYTFKESFPEHLQRYIPNEYYRQPGLLERLDWASLMPSMVCIATRVIADEELFMNYRLNPRHPHLHPDWYHQPDPLGAELRYAPLRSWWYNPF